MGYYAILWQKTKSTVHLEQYIPENINGGKNGEDLRKEQHQ